MKERAASTASSISSAVSRMRCTASHVPPSDARNVKRSFETVSVSGAGGVNAAGASTNSARDVTESANLEDRPETEPCEDRPRHLDGVNAEDGRALLDGVVPARADECAVRTAPARLGADVPAHQEPPTRRVEQRRAADDLTVDPREEELLVLRLRAGPRLVVPRARGGALVVRQLERLPGDLQQLLELLACLER